MVEQSHAGKRHDHTVFVALFDNQVVPNGAARLGDVLDAGGSGPLDVVGEGEEGVGAQGHAVKLSEEFPLVFRGQPVGPAGKVVLPDADAADILLVAVDVAVNDVVPALEPARRVQ